MQLAGRPLGFDQHYVVESFNSIVSRGERVNLRGDFYERRCLGPPQVDLNVSREHERRLLPRVLDYRKVVHVILSQLGPRRVGARSRP